MTTKSELLIHHFAPIYNKQSRFLILGSFPSSISRKTQFYYGNTQNRFWKVLSAIFNCPLPICIKEKITLLKTHNIALWDIVKTCNIEGSKDSSIKVHDFNDIKSLLPLTNIKMIIANGTKAYSLTQKYYKAQKDFSPIMQSVCIKKLPSTSPSNARYTLEKLIECYKQCLT